ncbi:uncharacterized protein LOC116305226 [Actinia tenebrosa]|uniref:Uncharacterized protein LOC116305226 n=1 Tax=Actinia tenebrosa TaxID=6105 RepID=A0A6P8IUI1_ACTTE|nr:uncharacterized protein LOC116305226 [Actinia tenebrosa]
MRIRTQTIGKILALLSLLLVIFSLKMLFEGGNLHRPFETTAIQNSKSISEGKVVAVTGQIEKQTPRIEFSYRKSRQFSLETELMSSYTIKTATNTTCLSLGTRFSTYDRCICRKGWLGESCNIPEKTLIDINIYWLTFMLMAEDNDYFSNSRDLFTLLMAEDKHKPS